MPSRFQEIADDLRERITSGEFSPGENLPGYRQLGREYEVSSDILRRALAQLEGEGLIEIVKKRGITVRPRGERRRLSRGTAIMRDPARGYIFPAASRPDEPWQAHGRPRRSFETIPDDLAALLGAPAGSEVLRRRRVMSPAGEPPFDITDTWIHPAIVDEVPQVAEARRDP